MTTAVLVIILITMATNLWPVLPATARADLARLAATPQTVNTKPAPPAQVLDVSVPIQTDATPPNLPTGSYIAVDSASGEVLFAQDAAKRRPIASTTKIMTALVIMSRHDVTDVVTIPALPTYQTGEVRAGLVAGERYTIASLLEALLILSANDAADALAIIDAGSITKFAARMNAKANEWGIKDVRFASPSGLVDTGNYATAEALVKISRLLLTNAYLRQVIGTSSSTITSESGRQIQLNTTNQLLPSGKFYGIKTGYTQAAGECFVGLTRINGHEVITVALGSPDRFGASQALADWITTHWTWQ